MTGDRRHRHRDQLVQYYDNVPASISVEVRHWPSLAEMMACDLCEVCTGTVLPSKEGICTLVRPAKRPKDRLG